MGKEYCADLGKEQLLLDARPLHGPAEANSPAGSLTVLTGHPAGGPPPLCLLVCVQGRRGGARAQIYYIYGQVLHLKKGEMSPALGGPETPLAVLGDTGLHLHPPVCGGQQALLLQGVRCAASLGDHPRMLVEAVVAHDDLLRNHRVVGKMHY